MKWWGRMGLEMKLAVGALLALAVWMASGMWNGGDAPAEAEKTVSLPRVQVSPLVAQTYQPVITISGFTKADDQAMLAAQTAGRIDSVNVNRGQMVVKGEVLVSLDPADRAIKLRAAQAELTRSQKLVQAARKLAREGYLANTILAEREASYQAAQEGVASAKLDMRYTQLVAPFDGVVEDITATAGDYVGIGTPIITLVNRDEILLVGFAAQHDRGLLTAGSTISATLIDGTHVPATLRAIATDADPQTRTYRVEAAIDGRAYPVPTGMSAAMRLPAAPIQAWHVAHAWLVLNDAGSLGVMTVNTPSSASTVVFQPIQLLADNREGVWVSGLHENSRWVVSRGQAALTDGSRAYAQAINEENTP